MNSLRKAWVALAASVCLLDAQSVTEARKRFERVDYQGALDVLARAPLTAPALQLKGEVYYRMGEFGKSADVFEEAIRMDGKNSVLWNWLGRAQGRKAETGNPLRAPFFAGKARDAFERAVVLNPGNLEAVGDLFSYYLEAPGFLGGGLDKAEKLANERIRPRDEVEYATAMAQLAIARKQYDIAEKQLRRAVALAPKSADKLEDLARFLARRGRHKESDQEFKKARDLAPSSAKLLYDRAVLLVESKRDLGEAQRLLEDYLRMGRTPDDPSPEEARRLLKKIEEAKGL